MKICRIVRRTLRRFFVVVVVVASASLFYGVKGNRECACISICVGLPHPFAHSICEAVKIQFYFIEQHYSYLRRGFADRDLFNYNSYH